MKESEAVKSSSEPSPRIVQAAGLVLLTSEFPQRCLLMRHDDRWDFPKGHADPGEHALQTALRETFEETGIPSEDIQVDEQFRHVLEYTVHGKKRGAYTKRVTFFLGWLPTPRPIQLSEHVGYEWHPWPVDASIQVQTVDPLLAAVARFLAAK